MMTQSTGTLTIAGTATTSGTVATAFLDNIAFQAPVPDVSDYGPAAGAGVVTMMTGVNAPTGVAWSNVANIASSNPTYAADYGAPPEELFFANTSGVSWFNVLADFARNLQITGLSHSLGGLAVDQSGDLYITDTGNNEIWAYNPANAFSLIFPLPKTRPAPPALRTLPCWASRSR